MAENKASLILELKESVTAGINALGGKLQEFGQNLEKAKFIFAGTFGSIIAGIGLSLKAWGEEEKAVVKLTSALKNQGIVNKSVVEDLRENAQALQTLTGFTDDSIIAAQAQLVTFGLTGDALKEVTKATIDLSARKEIDLTTAANLLGKAFVGETAALAKHGITIEENITKSEKFSQVLKFINENMGGAAAAQHKTFEGSIIGVKNAMSDFMEKIGEHFAPVISEIAGKITEIIGKMGKFFEENEKVITQVIIFAGVLTGLFTAATAVALIVAGVAAAFGAIAAPIGLAIIAVSALTASFITGKGELSRLAEGGAKVAVSIGKAFVDLMRGDFSEAFGKMKDIARESFKTITDIIDGNARTIEERMQEKKDRILELETEQRDLSIQMEAQKQAAASLSYSIVAESEKASFEGMKELLRLRQELEDLTNKKNVESRKKANEEKALADKAAAILATKQVEDQNKIISEMEKTSRETRMKIQLAIAQKQYEEQEKGFETHKNFMVQGTNSQFEAIRVIAKAYLIRETIMNTHAAAMGAYKSLAMIPYVGVALALAAATATYAYGAERVAAIAAMAHGGVVLPTSGGTVARIGEAGSAEAVIPLNDSESTERIKEAIGGDGVTVNINAGVIVADDETMRQFAKKIDEELFELRRNRQSVSF